MSRERKSVMDQRGKSQDFRGYKMDVTMILVRKSVLSSLARGNCLIKTAVTRLAGKIVTGLIGSGKVFGYSLVISKKL